MASLFGNSDTSPPRPDLVILLGGLVFFWALWRVDFLITDNWTIANTLVAVADGHLYIDQLVYGPSRGAPGTYVSGEDLYGRNYGQVFLSVPILWLLRALTPLVELDVFLVLGWSALVFAFGRSVSGTVGRRSTGTIVAGAVAVGVLGLNALFTRPLDPRIIPLVALQLTTVLSAATIAVILYSLLARIYTRRIGSFAAAATILASPVAFWATVPKRHTITALLAILTLYTFYRSREADGDGRALKFRALSYVWVGLTTWVHAPEGLVLFVALGSVDLLTSRSNSPREVALVGAVFFVSLLPFFVTNTLISGNPLQPPRALTASTSVASGSGSGSQVGSDPEAGVFIVVLQELAEKARTFVRYMIRSAGTLSDGERLYEVFIRSGYDGVGLHKYATTPVNLSVLESMPLAGGLMAAPLVLSKRAIDGGRSFDIRTRDPKRATDYLAVVYVALLVVMYLPRLPLHVMFTMRYLHPIYPILIYALVRLTSVRRTVTREWRLLVSAYAVTVSVGGAVLLVLISIFASGVGDAVQLHARFSLGGAAVVAYWSVVATVYDGYERLGAVVLGFAGGMTTVYLILAAFEYFVYTSHFAIPVGRVVSETLSLV